MSVSRNSQLTRSGNATDGELDQDLAMQQVENLIRRVRLSDELGD